MRNFLPYLTVATLPCMLHAATKAKVDASKPEPTPAATVYQTEATYGVPELGNDFAADGEGCYRYQPVSDTEIDLKLCDVTIDPQTVLTYNGMGPPAIAPLLLPSYYPAPPRQSI